MKPRLIILGSSAGIASAHRASAGYLLDLGDSGILIDCGDGVTRNFLRAGFDVGWVNHIVISHTHADHICGLPYFIQQRHAARIKTPLSIYCAAESQTAIQDFLTMCHLYPEWLHFELRCVPLEPGSNWGIGPIQFEAFSTTHLDRQRAFAIENGYPDPGDCLAFRIEVGGAAVLYSADLGSVGDLDSVQGPIDRYLVESSHIDLDAIWPWAKKRHVKEVILTHLSDDLDSSSVEDIAKASSIKVIIAEDLMVFDLE